MKENHFHDDRPINEHEEDRLGYTEPAKHIANSILSLSSPEGFVLGLEGEWGSGKSSFVNLIIQALGDTSQPPEVIKFSPWLISTRAALLGELFQSIAVAALKIPLQEDASAKPTLREKVLSKTSLNRSAKKKELEKSLNAFGKHISNLSKIANVAEALGVPYAGTAGKALQAGGGAVSSSATPSLDKEKENLQSELRKLTRKVVVFIDDLDRLEPNEAVEIVRLVRAVVDFPNIVYVLCYSRRILAQSLSHALSIADGDKYINKIVQVTFSVPRPEDFDLRRMFKKKVEEFFPDQIHTDQEIRPNQMVQRLNEVIDFEGGRSLLTPRDVARGINSLRLYASPIIDKIDLADMTWLQLIRIRNHKLYEWIEEYMNTASVLVSGATLSEYGQNKMFDDLMSILDEERADKDSVMRMFVSMLPGIEDRYVEKEDKPRWRLFNSITRTSVAKFVQDGRLGSPQHFRYYFALTKPSMAMGDRDFQQFLEDAENNLEKAIKDFVSLSNTRRPQGGVWAEAIIDRLVDVGIEKVSEKSIPGIILSLASGMDKIALKTGVGDWGEYWTWNTAKSIMRSGLKRLNPAQRSELVYRVFEEGEALGWLTSLLRDETFDHGIAGKNKKSEDEWMLTSEEYSNVSKAMKARYKNTSPNNLIKTPRFSNILFGWMQLGTDEEKEVQEWVESFISTDEGLVLLMDALRSWLSRNGEVLYPLKAESIKFFCDVEKIDNRLKSIAENPSHQFSSRADELLRARAMARDF